MITFHLGGVQAYWQNGKLVLQCSSAFAAPHRTWRIRLGRDGEPS